MHPLLRLILKKTNDNLPPAFTQETAQALVGLAVRKRRIEPQDPSAGVGQIGKVIGYQPSDEIIDGYSVIVEWGDDNRWAYHPNDFGDDVDIHFHA